MQPSRCGGVTGHESFQICQQNKVILFVGVNLQAKSISHILGNWNCRRWLYFIEENNCPGMKIYTFLQNWWSSIFPLLHIWEISTSPKETFEAQARAKPVEPWEHLGVCSSSRSLLLPPRGDQSLATTAPELKKPSLVRDEVLQTPLLQSMEKKEILFTQSNGGEMIRDERTNWK